MAVKPSQRSISSAGSAPRSRYAITDASPAAVDPPSPTKIRPRLSWVSVVGTKSPAPAVVSSYVAKTVTVKASEPSSPPENSGVSFHTVRVPASVTSAYASSPRPLAAGSTTVTALGTTVGSVPAVVPVVAGRSPVPGPATPPSGGTGVAPSVAGGVVPSITGTSPVPWSAVPPSVVPVPSAVGGVVPSITGTS